MRARIRTIGFLALAALVSPAYAAVAPGLVVQEPQLSSAAAQQLVEACTAIAAKTNAPMAIAVVDPAGNLLHFHALQGASPTAPITAQLKAETAARWRRATSQLDEQVKNGGNRGPVYLRDFPIGGGLPIIQGGHTLGAIGVAGPGNIEACAEEAVKAVFGNSVDTGRTAGQP
jgi:glc operon protein GlcG